MPCVCASADVCHVCARLVCHLCVGVWFVMCVRASGFSFACVRLVCRFCVRVFGCIRGNTSLQYKIGPHRDAGGVETTIASMRLHPDAGRSLQVVVSSSSSSLLSLLVLEGP